MHARQITRLCHVRAVVSIFLARVVVLNMLAQQSRRPLILLSFIKLHMHALAFINIFRDLGGFRIMESYVHKTCLRIARGERSYTHSSWARTSRSETDTDDDCRAAAATRDRRTPAVCRSRRLALGKENMIREPQTKPEEKNEPQAEQRKKDGRAARSNTHVGSYVYLHDHA